MLLNGWKAIANYLQSGVRTVQRWEGEGLPILRPRGGTSGHVVAYTADLDRWMKRSSNGASRHCNLETEIERTRQLLLTMSRERVQMHARLHELRGELASLRKNHRRDRTKRHR
jgi:phage terminase Nu1 subunit (DNA packaging protein)